MSQKRIKIADIDATGTPDGTKALLGDGTWGTVGGTPAWGDITGTIADQGDLQAELDEKVGISNDETITGVKDFQNGAVIRGFYTASSPDDSNINMHGRGATITADAGLQLLGSSITSVRVASKGATAATPAADYSYSSWILGTMAVTEAATGTHPIMSQLAIKPLDITTGTGDTDNTATLYIEGAATEGNNNYAIWVDSGDTRLDGGLSVSNTVILSGNLLASSFAGLGNNALNVYSAIGYAGDDAARIYSIGGETVVSMSAYKTSTYGIADDYSYAHFMLGSSAVTEGSSGTHSIIANLAIKPIDITTGAATTASTATLYIEGMATEGNDNYSLWVDSGNSRFDGTTEFGSITIFNGSINAYSGAGIAGGVTINEMSAPSTPSSGYGIIYAKSDGKAYFKNDSGTEINMTDVNPTSINMYQALGSPIKAEPAWNVSAMSANYIQLVDGWTFYIAVWLPVAATITGVTWWQGDQGDYTADNYNGVGLYTYSGGTLTKVASSTNDGNVWKASANGWATKDFSNTYNATAGLYYIAALYNNSAQISAPSIGRAANAWWGGMLAPGMTNSAGLSKVDTSGVTSLPSTIVMSSMSHDNLYYFALY